MCQYCLHNPCLPGCPNYEEPKAVYHCSICGQGIFEGEEYIENGGDYIHFEMYTGFEMVTRLVRIRCKGDARF